MRDGPVGTTLRGAEFEKTEGLRGPEREHRQVRVLRLRASSERWRSIGSGSGASASGGSGSFVRGEEREESDIDILIEFEEGGRSFDAYMDLKFFLEDLFRERVDLVDRDTVKPALAPYILRSVRYAPGNKQERMICDAGRDTML